MFGSDFNKFKRKKEEKEEKKPEMKKETTKQPMAGETSTDVSEKPETSSGVGVVGGTPMPETVTEEPKVEAEKDEEEEMSPTPGATPAGTPMPETVTEEPKMETEKKESTPEPSMSTGTTPDTPMSDTVTEEPKKKPEEPEQQTLSSEISKESSTGGQSGSAPRPAEVTGEMGDDEEEIVDDTPSPGTVETSKAPQVGTEETSTPNTSAPEPDETEDKPSPAPVPKEIDEEDTE